MANLTPEQEQDAQAIAKATGLDLGSAREAVAAHAGVEQPCVTEV